LNAGTKFILFICVVLIAVLLIRRADVAVNPALPKDMPSNARFLPTGYDLTHNERRGTWVACQANGPGVSFCRVTDPHGLVIFQGDYLPVRDSRAVADSDTTPALGNSRLQWVQGPLEGTPVPIIPTSDGTWLVPIGDRDALVDRWNQNPQEWQKLTADQE
jgi:hypothetical protein